MATKRSREEDGEVLPDLKKMHAETVTLLDREDAVHRQFEPVGVPGEGNAVEEGVASGAMTSLKEEIHQPPSVFGEETLTFETAAHSGDGSLLDAGINDKSSSTTPLSDELLTVMDSSASSVQMPENESPSNVPIPSSVEAGSIASGSPLGYLLGASDDELGLPPPTSIGCESAASLALLEPAVGFLVDDWRFDEEFQAMRAQGFGLCEADDAWGEPDIAVDDGGFCSLFDHSGVADGSSFFLFSGNASS
ncbi:uncharacterized protein LOC116264400 [Nymphaea colorata]|uniref:uncharacterized protein LOC116264400 n=1 Tax=Nymphaea colorata TaxID=210225 RepID=UPI00129D3C19|nr:uncharacterized protein LOC116264400 [Nymphaea colorata]